MLADVLQSRHAIGRGEAVIDEIVGTFVGRWYVTAFGVAFAVTAVRSIGARRTAIYTAVAIAVGIAAENASVHWGIPYTRYAFDESLRGDELWVGDVPLMVSLSYTFMSWFGFAAGRLLVSGPWRTRDGSVPWEMAAGVLLTVWGIWIVDPVSRLGDHFFLGELFRYDGPGFWFGLPLGSQAGFTVTSAILVGTLTWLDRDAPVRRVVDPWRHEYLPAASGLLGQVLFMTGAALWVGRDVAEANALAGATLLIYLPLLFVAAIHWRSLRPGRPAL